MRVFTCSTAAVLALAACERADQTSVPAPGSAVPRPDPKPASVPVALPAKVSFNDHIQPILSEYCYHCHGPDSGTREPKDAPLRLDRPADAFAPRDNGKPVITKGDPADSLLIKLIKSGDPEEIMPPPKSHKTLKQTEIALLERWIEQGAEYQAHWAFLPPARPPLPEAPENTPGWDKNPLDRFVAEKLAANGFAPNPPEDPARFFRRLHLDLTGLPPAPADVAAFVGQHAKDPEAATAAAADRLLASPASAEHLARHWLDAARYADTHGIHIDNYRAIWPYRDWVIQAFQQNMRWDQFTVEQIAGDLLENPTLDQRVATGFNRCLATTGEGGAIPEEYDAIYAKDRVDTTAAVWLGLTTGCASCHDHKFDPLTMKDFYSFAAFFRNTPMSALDGNNAEHPPNTFVPLAADRPRWDQVAADISSTEKQVADRKNSAKPEFETWAATAGTTPPPETGAPPALHLPLADPDGPLRGSVDGQPREWPAPNIPRVDGPLGKAVATDSLDLELGDLASFKRADQVSYGCFVRLDADAAGSLVARMEPGADFRGWDIWFEQGRPGSHVIDTWPGAANKLMANQPLAKGSWHHLMFTFDGTKAPHEAMTLYIDGEPAAATLANASVGNNIETPVPLRLGARHGGVNQLSGKAAIQDFRFYRRLLGADEIRALARSSVLQTILAVAPGQRTPQQVDSLYQYYLDNVDPASKQLRAKLDGFKKEQADIRARGSVSLVMEERKDSEPFAHILNRGAYSDKREKVTANTPEVLPPMPADAPKNRLGLARWLTDPANPLPARVTMNRTWYYFFGTGIVETTEDFGIMGSRPSHPQLLDWLAAEFIGSGWDYRHMLKLIATSATYRQAATTTPEQLEKDPFNRLLTRGPRYRLDAEQIRDLALAASGLLSPKIGGPPVKPYQPEGIWEAVAMPQSNTRSYQPDTGEALYRRSLYTLWKRTAPPPSMEILNAPSRETFCVRRERTNTPIQALVTLNDPQFVEASRALAAKAIKSAADFDPRLDHVTQSLLGRTLVAGERAFVRATVDKALAAYQADPAAAKQLLATGETKAAADIPEPELAAWTLAASQVLNLDECLAK